MKFSQNWHDSPLTGNTVNAAGIKLKEDNRLLSPQALADPRGTTGVHPFLSTPPPPHGTQFFRFCIRFHPKVPASEVGAPSHPTGNPGPATDRASNFIFRRDRGQGCF